MAGLSTPHDTFFRALFGDAGRAGEVLRTHLPAAITARLKDSPPIPLDGSFIDEDLRTSQSDQLFRVEMTDGRTAYIYVLYEHKSAPDGLTPLQLLRYMTRIWTRLAESEDAPAPLPPIVPVVVYHGARPWRVPRSMVEAVSDDAAVQAELRDLRYTLLDLGDIPDAELARHSETRSGLMALKYAYRGERMDRLVEILRGLSDGSVLEEQLMAYIVEVFHELTPERLRAAVREARPEQEDRMVSLAAQTWMKQGEARGEARGKATAVLIALRTRFGRLDSAIEQRVYAAPVDQLDTLLQRAVTAETLDGVFSADPEGSG